MRSALYYPHITIEDENFLKTALLLWDQLEFIVPWRGFKPNYRNRDIAEAMELFGVARVPSAVEQKKAHECIEDLISRELPPDFYFGLGISDTQRRYEIYPEKLMENTWHLLRESRLAEEMTFYQRDMATTEPAGLTIMSILADCCAGQTRVRITDRAEAYATLTNVLSRYSGEQYSYSVDLHEALVPITLRVVDMSSITLQSLIAFRKREENQIGLKALRHSYLAHIEKYVSRLIETKGNSADGAEIKRIFEDDMRQDLFALKTEIGFAKRDALLSKEIMVTAIASVGTVASACFGIAAPLLGAITAAGLPATVGGLLGAGNRYLSTRRAILQKHPISYLYEMPVGRG